MNGKSRKKKLRDVSPVREEDSTETDTDSFRNSMNRRSTALSASNATLTNVSLIICLKKKNLNSFFFLPLNRVVTLQLPVRSVEQRSKQQIPRKVKRNKIVKNY